MMDEYWKSDGDADTNACRNRVVMATRRTVRAVFDSTFYNDAPIVRSFRVFVVAVNVIMLFIIKTVLIAFGTAIRAVSRFNVDLFRFTRDGWMIGGDFMIFRDGAIDTDTSAEKNDGDPYGSGHEHFFHVGSQVVDVRDQFTATQLNLS
ncbi:MAG: hypothetical protein ACJAYE_001771 [Candidatus Azotimanducaceae bacterium]|jgi:hypothetical protein